MADAKARVTGDFSSLVKGADDAAKSLVALSGKIAGLANPLNIATSAIGGTITALGKIGLAAQGIEAIGKSAAAMGMGLLQGNAALEMTTISFKTLLGSASAADAMIKQLTKFAAQTPFQLAGLESQTQRLLAFGFQANEIIPIMTSLGDAIAALGGTQDNLNSLVYVMGQMRQEAHINAGDIMQMVNLGIPALQMLADHYHMTTGQIQEMISKGLIPGKEAVDILTKGLEQKYGGMMAAQSSTFSGMLSNLQDWAAATTLVLTKPLFEPAKKALAVFLDFVQSPQGVAVINRMAADIQKGVDKATAAFVRFEPQIKPTLERLLKVAEAIRGQMTPGIITLIPLLFQFWQRVEPIVLALWKFEQAVKPVNVALAALRGYMTGGLPGAVDALKGRFELIGSYVKKGLDLALDQARKFGPVILKWVSDTAIYLANKAVTWGEALIEWVAPYAVKLIGALIQLAERVVTWIVGYAPVIANRVLDWAEAIAGFVIPLIPRILTLLVQLGLRILNWIEMEAPILVRMLLNWTDAMTGWILPAIPGIIRALEQIGVTILNWGINRLPVIMGQIVAGVGRGLGVNLQGVVNDTLKVFYSLVNNIRNILLPAFTQMARFLSANFLPLFDRLTTFIARTVIPTAASLAAFVMTTLVPAFVRAADLVGLIFGPALTLIGSIIRNELLPALSDSWNYFDSKYMPTVRDLAATVGEKLADGIRLATDRFKDAWPVLEGFYNRISPVLEKVIDLWKTFSPLSLAIDVFNGFLKGGLQGALTVISDKFSKLQDVLGDVLDWVGKNGPTLFNNLMTWAGKFGDMALAAIDKMMPQIQALLTKLLNFIGDNAPKLLDMLIRWAEKFGDWVVSAAIKMAPELVKLFGKLVDWVAARAPELLTKVLDWAIQFGNMVLQIWPKMYKELPKLFDSFTGWIKDQSPKIVNQVVDWAKALVMWVVNDAIPTWFREAPKLWSAMLQFIGDAAQKIRAEMPTWVNAFQKWVYDVIRDMPNTVGSILSSFRESILNNKQSIFSIGDLIGYYLVNGLKNSPFGLVIGWLNDAANLLGIQGRLPGYAGGTQSAARGLAMVGEQGAELIKSVNGQLMLITKPMLLNMHGGEKVFNNQQTSSLFRQLPASAQQITNMYHNANSYGGNSYSSVSNYNLGGVHTAATAGQVVQSFGMMRVMYGRS